MGIDLGAALPILMPRAIAWAGGQAAVSIQRGVVLPPGLVQLAQYVKVQHPERIRVDIVDAMPLPDDELLRAAASQVGLFGSNTAGLTLGYAVLIKRGCENDTRLLSHEFRHVSQYEACGSIEAFLTVQLRHLVAYGYEDSPFEVDARAHEYHGA